MNNLISSNELTMSSREIAELLNKTHSNIKISAQRMAERGTIAVQGSRFIHNGNEYTEYFLNKRDSLILVAQNSPEFTAVLVDRWQELESKQLQPTLPSNYIEALESLIASEKEKAVLNEQLQIAQPKIAFVDNYTQADTGSKGFREVAKLLKIKEKDFRSFLVDKKIMYRLAGNWTAYANHIDTGRFEVVTGETNGHIHNTTKFTGKGIEWIAGLYAQHKISEK